MSDMEDTVIPKSDQLNADDFVGGRTITITITRTKVTKGDEQPCVLWYKDGNAETNKPYKPCKSMRRVLIQVWGKDSQQYVGKALTLYRDSTVKFGGLEVGGIRISHMSDMDGNKAVTLALTASKANKKPFTVKPLINHAAGQQKLPPPIDPEIKSAGDDAASEGVVAYTAWLQSLDPSVKETVRPFHKSWCDIAKSVVTKQLELEDDETVFNDEAVGM